MKQIGLLLWYDKDKGFGLISTQESIYHNNKNMSMSQSYNEVFIHVTNWVDDKELSFAENLFLVFDVSFERGKISAKQCRFFNYSTEDIELFFDSFLLDNTRLLTLQNIDIPAKIIDLIFKQEYPLDANFINIFSNKLSIIEDNIFIPYIDLADKILTKKHSLKLRDVIHKEILQRKDEKLSFWAWSNGYIQSDEVSIDEIQENIEKINLDLYMQLHTHRDIGKITWLILLQSKNQSLLEYIITDIEKILSNEIDFLKLCEVIESNIFNFVPKNQVLFMKKIFQLKALNIIQFAPKDLIIFNSQNFIDEANNQKTFFDSSTFLIANIIQQFDSHGKFLAENELIKNVLKFIGFDKSRKISIDHFFDKCIGVTLPKISDNANGSIIKDKFLSSNGTEKYYFKVILNSNENLTNFIQNLDGSKFNNEMNFWGVPLKYENELLSFAKEYRLVVESDNRYDDNPHLLELHTYDKNKPEGITFCSGIEAKDTDLKTGMKFWWCTGRPCYLSTINLHVPEDWKNYTLYDFMNILKFSLDEIRGGHSIRNGLFIQFVTVLNRFEKLLEKMYCKECTHILYPTETSYVSAHSVIRFSCENENCSSHKNIIYLNHCLNGQCNAIIDSRESKKCPNGLYICDKCGSCCSHAMFERRCDNLTKNSKRVPDDLMEKINFHLAHLEKAEYFCFKCGQWMEEVSEDLFQCKNCSVSYSLQKYPHLKKIQVWKKERNPNYPVLSDDLESSLKAILLKEKVLLEKNGRSKGQIFGILYNKNVDIDGNQISLKILNNKQLTNEIFS